MRPIHVALSILILALPPLANADSGGEPVGPGLYRLHGDDPGLPSADLEPLRKILGNAEMIGLGEPAHSSGGVYRMKHRLFRFLVEEMGVRALGFESPWIGADRAAAYVQTCGGSPEDALKGLFTNSQSTETRDLVRWMCEWNLAHPEDRVHFYGFDFQNEAKPNGQALLGFLARLEVGDGDPLAAGLRACDGVEESFYPARPFPLERYRQCQEALSGLATWFDAHGKEIEKRTSRQDLAQARIHLLSERAVQEFQPYVRSDFFRAWNIREKAMADLALAIRDLRFPGQRVAVWAQNGHVSRDGYYGLFSVVMGNFLKEELGDRYANLAIAVHDLYLEWFPRNLCGLQPLEGDHPVESVLRRTGEDFLLLDLDPRGGHPAFLAPGVTYEVGGAPMIPAEHYDALIYMNISPGMHPLAYPACP